MDTYIVTLFIFGAIVLLTTWLQLAPKAHATLTSDMLHRDRHAFGLVAAHISTLVQPFGKHRMG